MSNTRSGDDQGAAAEAGAIGEHLTSEESEQATCGLLNSGRLSESGRLCILCGLCGKETSLIVPVCNTVQLKFSLGYTEGRNRH